MATSGSDEGIPTIPDIATGDRDEILQALKTWVETRQGDVGTGLGRAVTLEDLINVGVVSDVHAYSILHNGRLPRVPGSPTEAAIPPTPSHLTAAGAVENIILTWIFPYDYLRLSHFEIWRGVDDNIADAVLHAQPKAMIYTDQVGASAVYYYWVRAVSDSGMSPFSRMEGTKGSTAMDVGDALTALEGSIMEHHLHETLGSRIGLIDGPANMPGTVNARVKTETDARIAANQATANQITSLNTNVGQIAADLVQESIAWSNAHGALAQQIDTAQAQTAAAVVAVQQESIARITADDTLFAQHTIKLDLNGYVSGYGLASSSPSHGPSTSMFEIRADRFAIASPTGPGIAPVIPFVVQTTPTTENGVEVPVGVYMENAMIRNGTITNLKVADGAIDTAKISSLSADKITFGEMHGNRIQADTMEANRITADSFTAYVASINSAYITSANIVNLAVTSAKLANASVVSAKIQDGAIVTAKIGNLQVDTAKLAGNAVSTTAYLEYNGSAAVYVQTGDVVVVTAAGQAGFVVNWQGVPLLTCNHRIQADYLGMPDWINYHTTKNRAMYVTDAAPGSMFQFTSSGGSQTSGLVGTAIITVYRR